MFGPDWTGHEAQEFTSTLERFKLYASINHRTGATPVVDALQRVGVVTGWLIRLCERGALKAFVRDETNGDMIEVPTQFWNVEKVYHRFVRGKMSLARPAAEEIDGEGFFPIFFRSSRLAALLAELTAEARGEGRVVVKNPFAQATWNLDQALIWYAGRNMRPVADASDPVDSEKERPLTWVVYGMDFDDPLKIQADFMAQLRSGAITVLWERGGNLDELERSWLQHATIYIDKEFVASLHRTDLEADTSAHESLGIPIQRRYTREIKPRFNPAQLDNAFPAPIHESEFRDSPDANPDEPEICFADAVFWWAAKRAEASGKFEAEEHDQAQRDIIKAARAERLTLRGYKKEAGEQRKVSVLPPDELRELDFSILGGQPEFDRKEHGPRYYGVAWADNGPVDLWTGVYLKKKELLSAFLMDKTVQRQTAAPQETKSEEGNENGFGITITSADPSEPKKRTRPDSLRGDEEFARALNTLGRRIRAWRDGKELPKHSRELARLIQARELDLAAKIGGEETLRKVIDGRNDRANRLSSQGMAEKWWPVFDRPNYGADG
jgi:hypothetical protein